MLGVQTHSSGAQELISKRVLKIPVDKGYTGPVECSQAASPLAQAEERINKRLLKNPIDMCYKGPAECQRSARGGQSAGSGGGEEQ